MNNMSTFGNQLHVFQYSTDVLCIIYQRITQHAVFGKVQSDADQAVVDSIQQLDRIKSIEIIES